MDPADFTTDSGRTRYRTGSVPPDPSVPADPSSEEGTLMSVLQLLSLLLALSVAVHSG